jgi:hypothetical protein
MAPDLIAMLSPVYRDARENYRWDRFERVGA